MTVNRVCDYPDHIIRAAQQVKALRVPAEDVEAGAHHALATVFRAEIQHPGFAGDGGGDGQSEVSCAGAGVAAEHGQHAGGKVWLPEPILGAGSTSAKVSRSGRGVGRDSKARRWRVVLARSTRRRSASICLKAS